MRKKNIHSQCRLPDKKSPSCSLLSIFQFMVIALLFLFYGAQTAYSKDYKISRRSGDHIIDVQLDRYPLVLGDNSIKIEIRDMSGRFIKDAKVLVNYYMPPMPRMVPMNYKVKADLDKEAYVADMGIIMAGPWYIKIIYRYMGKISTAKFNVDAQ